MRRFLLYWVFAASLLGVALFRANQTRATFSASDLAVIETYTILAEHGKLWVGPYSRFSWHHPGPMYFYLLAPFDWVTGRTSAGVESGAFAINLLAVLTMMALAISLSDAMYMLALSALVTLYVTRFPSVLTSAWNPHVIVLPTAALVIATIAATTGSWRSPRCGAA